MHAIQRQRAFFILQFSQRFTHSQTTQPFGRRNKGTDRSKQDEANDDRQRSNRKFPAVVWKMRGDKPLVEQPVQRQAKRDPAERAAHSICRSFSSDHTRELAAIHANSAHGAILARTRCDAHGNAVDNVQHSDQRDDREKTIDEQAERPERAAIGFIAPVDELTNAAHALSDRSHFGIAGVLCELYIDDAIVALAGEPLKSFI